jgi:hypothetical protein
MATEGNWLYMKIAGQPWLEKPPLPRYAVGLPGAGDSLIGGIGSNQCISLPGAFAVGASPSVPDPVVVGLLYVHGRILPLLDPNRDGRDFLATVQHLVPEKATLFATGGPQVLRYSFYVKRPLISPMGPAGHRSSDR